MDRQRENPSPRVNGETGRGEGSCNRNESCRRPQTSPKLLAALVALLFAPILYAASMTVEPRTAALDQPVTITITLDGDLARLDAIELPLENLVIESGPSVSSQFEWVNGATTRQKRFRWIVYPERPGEAFIGPVALESRGASEVLPRMSVSVLPDPLDGAMSAEEVARRLIATGRDRIFIFPEIDRTDVFVGEQVVVTWYLYTAESIRDLDISSTPPLREFWTEEIPLADEPGRDVQLAGISMRRLPLRRVALFPLQSGTVNAGRLVAVAEVMRPIRDRFGVFSAVERRVGRVILRSYAPELRVQPLPAGTRADAVGSYGLKCTQPRVPPEGPVSFDVVVSGEGNLRSAQQPSFSVSPDARVEVQDQGVTVNRTRGRVTMARNWRFIVFPRRSGRLDIPAVVFYTWDPASRSGSKLECEGRQVTANVATAVMASPAEEGASTEPSSSGGGLVAGLGLVLLAGLASIFWWRIRGRRSSTTALELIRHADPAAMRLALHEVLARNGLTSELLFRDGSELGETFRSLQSLLDIRERETLTADRSPAELEARAREFGRELDRAMAARSHTRTQ